MNAIQLLVNDITCKNCPYITSMVNPDENQITLHKRYYCLQLFWKWVVYW